MEFSEKEQAVLDLIKREGKVTIKQIETLLSKAHVGGIGKLIQAELIEKQTMRTGEGYNIKNYKCYVIKEK